MSILPPDLHWALNESLGAEPQRAVMLSGGMINRAARVETKDGPVFVKWNDHAPPGLFTAEVRGLIALQATKTIRVPAVIAAEEKASPAYLVLEYIEEHPPSDPARFTQHFAERLAAQNRATTSIRGTFGLEEDNYLGAHLQVNTPHARWPDFYRECRLLPQIALARQKRLLPAERERLVMRVVEHLESLLDGLESRPALLHGDLWSGNFLQAGHEAVVIDPAVYHGEREMEIAFVELFGGFPTGFVQAYRDIYPLDAGYEGRRPLHQLYPLLVHLNHFGEMYGPHVERVCRLLQ
ncbi:MAG: fructosamine kinase family protein [Armatimonadota bacterium]|nr:fructosamine kinase family protein [Armatimonadota bacterium]